MWLLWSTDNVKHVRPCQHFFFIICHAGAYDGFKKSIFFYINYICFNLDDHENPVNQNIWRSWKRSIFLFRTLRFYIFDSHSLYSSLNHNDEKDLLHLNVGQKILTDTVHKDSEPQRVSAGRAESIKMCEKSWVEGEKKACAQATGRGLWSEADSRTWWSFTQSGLRLESEHQEPPLTDVSRTWVTPVKRHATPEPETTSDMSHRGWE